MICSPSQDAGERVLHQGPDGSNRERQAQGELKVNLTWLHSLETEDPSNVPQKSKSSESNTAQDNSVKW